ncbi:type IV pilin protein [Lysobacter korlensis]|uniref:Type IV pilin protein n=1 Tax=Lysobacter korlensis TaxID=553636 RepID=A0ABV6RPI8_9GAMM
MKKQRGFTLIELMITVAVIAILAAIALPSYNEYVRKGRRSEAARFVGEMQLGLERWRAENPSYAPCAPAPCGSGVYPAAPSAAASPFYQLDVPAATATATNYVITATPRTGSAQAGDRCGVLTLTKAAGKPSWATASCN